MPEKRRPKKPSGEDSSAEEIEVRFRTFLGISPRTYVPVAYAVIIILVLFFLLVYPGIRNSGTMVTVTSVPLGASVRVDGTRVGATPVEVFVTKGRRTIEIVKPFFSPYSEPTDIGGRIFGSLVLPRRLAISADLDIADEFELLDDAATRFSRWSLVGRSSAQYQFPLVVSPAVEDVVFGGAATEQLGDFILSAAAATRSDLQLRDVVRGAILVAQDGAVLGSRTLVAAMRSPAVMARERPATPFWFAGATSAVPEFDEYRTSAYFQAHLESYTTDLITESLRSDSSAVTIRPSIRAFAGVEFARVPAGRVVLGGMDGTESGIDPFEVPVVREVAEFFMMRTEVPVGLYRRFVADRPEYAPENRSALVEEGVADEGYLAPFGNRDYLSEAEDDEPVVAVSFAAAAAFAEWLESQLGPVDAEVRLPSEEEWEHAAVVNGDSREDAWLFSEGVAQSAEATGPRSVVGGNAGRLGIVDLLGNVWEWTSDWYRPAAYSFKRPGGATEGLSFPSSTRVVRGGSWANPSGEVSIRSRGAQEPAWSTPYLGFRVVLVQNNGN